MSTKKISSEIMREQLESEDLSSWTDDDIPLSHIRNNSSKSKVYSKKFRKTNVSTKTEKKPQNDKKMKNKSYQYYKGKKVFTKSDSESSDFEKYTYFDEGKTKRKIKIHPDISVENLRKKIREIKMENICLMKEHERISEVKLRERMKLREEVIRLKNGILKLELQNHLKGFSSSTNSAPYEIIKQLNNKKESLETLMKDDDAIVNIQVLTKNIESFGFTDVEFWKNFNNIETTLSPLGPLWTGDLDHISPNTDGFFKPKDEVVKILSLNELLDNYPYDNFTWNEKPSLRRKTECDDNVQDSNKSINENNNYNLLRNKDTSNNPTEDRNDKSIEDNEDKNNSTVNTVIDMDISSEIDVESISQDDDIVQVEDYINCDDEVRPQSAVQHEEKAEEDNNIDFEEDGICSECGNGTTWTSFISRHREAYNKNITLPPCNTCNMKFLKSGHFDGKHRLKCPRPVKYRPATFMCTECGERCTSKSGLTQHELKHREAQYACQLCSYKCRRKSYLKVHMKIHNANTRPQNEHQNYTCSFCSYTTNKCSSIKSHINMHTNRKTFSCTHCDYTTSSKSYLKSHINYHTGFKPFKCGECPYRCVTSTCLNVHKKTHDGIKDYACTVCEYKTTSNYNLKIHFKKHKKVVGALV